MKINNERILRDKAKLAEISQKQLPVKVSYAIAKNIAKLESELKIYDKEREKIIEKYSEKDEKGKTIVEEGQIKLKEGFLDELNEDMKELLAIEADIDFHKFSIALLEGYDMAPAELMAIDYMLED